ncbi:MAG TPA: lytic transglycosylase domain-containing protein [Clostridia bacterium]|jgi:soluble lytic murein transglycosylase|nr:MAG: Soluble lytic murein transglycosylase precursor [Firmicutes bacterium ADurb.Bin248]HOG00793.1 lytic transglycosylase domain-containing protein [Clostridia bacterium]HOS18569.1 lytic transglycosylase domain-containing protein [Clostridia bacterium]HPK15695.1 lytic transglycosylase domain-containing protein [Clostridia bacterium]
MAAAAGAKRKKKKLRVNPKRFIPVLALLIILVGVAGYYLSRALEKKTYTLAYAAEIQACAEEFGVDPYLVASVIFVESSGRPEVVSPKGAVGLMQIMPDTGEWIAGKLDLADYTEASLIVPADNIRLGCWYLRYLLDRYENRENALAAYNAGPGNVDKWLKDENYAKDGRLTNIPFEETAHYIERVDWAYGVYTELYHDEFDE